MDSTKAPPWPRLRRTGSPTTSGWHGPRPTGIREAWFVDTDARRIEQLVLGSDGAYGTPLVHEPGASVTSVAVPDLAVEVDEVLPAAEEDPT